MLKVQNYLINNSLQKLKEEFGINYNFHNKYKNLVNLKYDQIKSPKFHPITTECRGLILDINKNYKIVNYGFNRFFNLGETDIKLDWSTTDVLSKEDGTLIHLYNYNSEWLLSTLGTADAQGSTNNPNLNFEQLFWKIFNELNYKLPENKFCTYIFELCTKDNKVVVDYFTPKLFLLGIRNLIDYKELNYNQLSIICNKYDWEIIKKFNFDDINEIKNIVNNYKGNEQEGFILVDKNFNRLKIKNINYLCLHQLKNNINNDYNLLDLIRRNEISEILCYFHDYKLEIIINDLTIKYYNLIDKINTIFEENKYIDNKKEFALKVKDYLFSPILFKLFNKEINCIAEYLVSMDIKKLYLWINNEKK